MNREILFRGKRKDNGEWVIGYLVRGKYYLYETEIIAIFPTDTIFYPQTETSGYDMVISDTVGQWTGLCDKNGNKIFEGDIVKVTTGLEGYKSTYHSTIHRVTYDVCNCGVAVFYPFDNSDMVEVEVIGNIYDNPELLEEIRNEN